MRITGPTTVTPVAALAAVTDMSLTVDITAGTYLIRYAQGHKSDAGNLPAGLLASLRAHVQARIEIVEGWAPGSSALT